MTEPQSNTSQVTTGGCGPDLSAGDGATPAVCEPPAGDPANPIQTQQEGSESDRKQGDGLQLPSPLTENDSQGEVKRAQKPSPVKKKSPPQQQADKPRTGRQLRSSKERGGMFGLMGALSLDSLQNQATGVGLLYGELMERHHCMWDANHPERPERLTTSLARCKHYNLVNRCASIKPRMATEKEILSVHSRDYHDTVKQSANMTQEQLAELSSHYDGIFFHPSTYQVSSMAAGSSIEMVEHVTSGKIRHGMALIRPPGHHAMKDEACGYCFFNNAVIAARHAINNLGARKVLLVDWDVHHGQGSQYLLYDDPRVLYFSMHRYEYGKFWPNLRESDLDYIGTGQGTGYNINVPINAIGMTDSDYMAMMQQILMPVAYEYNPDLVIVSCGYDAALGDPEGCSEVTPACFAHLTHMLKSLAGGRLVLLLEGGYCLESQAEAVALTLRCLLDDPCPPLSLLQPVLPITQQTILHVIRVLRPYWKSFAYHADAEAPEELPEFFKKIEIPRKGQEFLNSETRLAKFPIEDDYLTMSPAMTAECSDRINQLLAEVKLLSAPNRTCLVYDERMKLHKCLTQNEMYTTHPERPDRISRIYDRHADCGLVERCHALQGRHATVEELLYVHKEAYIQEVQDYRLKTLDELRQIESTLDSVYLSKEAYECALLATGCTLNVVKEVMSGGSRNGVAFVRPPGHHAEAHMAMGFCYFNSVAVAARYAQKHHGVSRVLILDWDVHHGNGTQHQFEDDPSVLYISLHRHDNGWFFPVGPDGNYDHVGNGDGAGFNVNIPWNESRMGDAEYVAAFQQVVMPIAYEYNPELVLVSAGFDAARGDPLGGCRVSPEGYAHMTHMLGSLASGKIILVLEGGYNLHSISESMVACTSVLLGDVCPPLFPEQPCDSALVSVTNVLDTHQHYWKSLQYRVKMPSRTATLEWLEGQFKVKPEADGDVKEEPSAKKPGKEQPKEEQEIEQLTLQLEQVKVEEASQAGSAAAVSGSQVTDRSEAGTAAEALGACGGGAKPKGVCIGDLIGQGPFSEEESMDLYAVTPLPWCPHLLSISSLPGRGLDSAAPCSVCGNVGENWVCLTCYQVHCSRYVNEHMLMHSLETEHRVVLSYADLSVWCYGCDHYVHNELLLPAKRTAHLDKFGEDLPGV